VISDITGATGMRIIRAIVAGERDPDTLASYRDIRCHSSAETVHQALIGNYREEHLFHIWPKPSSYMKSDAGGALYTVLGVDLTQIHGLGPYLALKLISGIRHGPLRMEPSAKHFASWLSLAPRNKISGGKILSSRTRPSGNRAGRAAEATTVGSDRDGIGSFLSPLAGADRKGKSSHGDSSKDFSPFPQRRSPLDGLCRSGRVLLRRALSAACPHQSNGVALGCIKGVSMAVS
jgi:hypothetical protein